MQGSNPVQAFFVTIQVVYAINIFRIKNGSRLKKCLFSLKLRQFPLQKVPLFAKIGMPGSEKHVNHFL